MNLEQAKLLVDNRPITAWMAWGIIKWNNDTYVIVTGFEMRRHPNMEVLYIRKGEVWVR